MDYIQIIRGEKVEGIFKTRSEKEKKVGKEAKKSMTKS